MASKSIYLHIKFLNIYDFIHRKSWSLWSFLGGLVIISSFPCVLPGLSDFLFDITHPRSLYIFNISFLCSFLSLGINVSLTITMAPPASFFSFLCPSCVFLCCWILPKSFYSLSMCIPFHVLHHFLSSTFWFVRNPVTVLKRQAIVQLHLQA